MWWCEAGVIRVDPENVVAIKKQGGLFRVGISVYKGLRHIHVVSFVSPTIAKSNSATCIALLWFVPAVVVASCSKIKACTFSGIFIIYIMLNTGMGQCIQCGKYSCSISCYKLASICAALRYKAKRPRLRPIFYSG